MDTWREQFPRLIWDKSMIGLAQVGLKGEWLAANPALCDLLEYTENELQRMTFQDVTHPQDVNDDMHNVDRLIAGRIDHYVMSKRYVTKTGRVVWIKLRVDPVKQPDGSVVCFLSQINSAIEIHADREVVIPKQAKPERTPVQAVVEFVVANKKAIGAALTAIVALGAWLENQRALATETHDTQKRIIQTLESIEGRITALEGR